MSAAAACALCDPALGPVIGEGVHWRPVVNRNQDLLGKCFLATRRHVEAVSALDAGEWKELHAMLATLTLALDAAFRPDHINYAFLQNQDRHVHLHLIPRYAGPRDFGGNRFDDPGYPGHYLVDRPPRGLEADELAALAEMVRQAAGM